MANHVVLLGDSILDNKAYVGGDPAVIDQVRENLPKGWQATLRAVDGSVARDVTRQTAKLPQDASHLIVSVGGNDALHQSDILTRPARSAVEVFAALADIRDRFDADYTAMLAAVLAVNKPTVICTIYDGNFSDAGQRRLSTAGLTIFNDCITRAAVRHSLPVLDLRLLFTAPEDYANPIEPSARGGVKIARLIRTIVTGHDFSSKNTVLYA
jgi:hypothetical protein